MTYNQVIVAIDFKTLVDLTTLSLKELLVIVPEWGPVPCVMLHPPLPEFQITMNGPLAGLA